MIEATTGDVEKMALLETAIFEATSREAGNTAMVGLRGPVGKSTSCLDQLLRSTEKDIESAINIHATAEKSAFIGLATSALLAIGKAISLAIVFTRAITIPRNQLVAAAREAYTDAREVIVGMRLDEMDLRGPYFELLPPALDFIFL